MFGPFKKKTDHSKIKVVNDLDELEGYISENVKHNGLTVTLFSQDNCKISQMVEEELFRLSQNLPNSSLTQFYKVEVGSEDDNSIQFTKNYELSETPSIIIFSKKDGKELTRYVGSDSDAINSIITFHHNK